MVDTKFNLVNIEGDLINTNFTGDATGLFDKIGDFVEKLGDGLINGTKEALLISKVLCFNGNFLDLVSERKLKEAELKQKIQEIFTPKDISSETSSRYNQLNALLKDARFFDVLEKALDILRTVPDEKILSDGVDGTFLNYFKQDVEMICDDDVRRMWANALCEEIKKPNSISIRTLNVLKGLRTEEKVLFNEMLHNSYNDGLIITNDRELPLTPEIINESILLLADAGLIDVSSIATNNYKNTNKLKFIEDGKAIYGNKLAQKYLLTSNSSFLVCLLPFKNSGKEIAQIINYQQTREEAISIAKEIFNQNSSNDFSLFENYYDESGNGTPSDSELIWTST